MIITKIVKIDLEVLESDNSIIEIHYQNPWDNFMLKLMYTEDDHLYHTIYSYIYILFKYIYLILLYNNY